jgi:hypothetical protein
MPDSRQSRRHLLQASAALALGDFLHLHSFAAARREATADSCILFFLNGGMSHLDTFDPKPEQPDGIRGEFKVIRTSAPCVPVTEHLPRMATQAHRYSVVRSVGFEGKLGNHSPACYHMLTGRDPQGDAAVLAPPLPTDHPTMGSASARLRPSHGSVPSFVMVPDVLIENAHLTPGQFAGWLGSRHQPFNLKRDPSQADFNVPALAPASDMTRDRLSARRALLELINSGRDSGREMEPHYQHAFDLLMGGKAQKAFDLDAEPLRLREQYGRNVVGQSLLLARRLVEAGVRFVNVHWPNVGGGRNWDTHSNGFNRLKNDLLPPTDRGVAALIKDLAERGLLKRTLVVIMTEFGRAPQIGKTFQNSGGVAGRDHWSNCFSIVLAGGGMRGGFVCGSSDAKGAFPADRALVPADIVATLYQALGIDPHVTLRDPEGRTHLLCEGKPVSELFG